MKPLTRIFKTMGNTAFLLAPLLAVAQGTRADYARAAKFLPPGVRHLVAEADVTPHWIEQTERLWYRKEGPEGKEFMLVGAATHTRAPAFDHAKLAIALSHAAGNPYRPNKLPFDSFEFPPKGEAIRFDAAGTHWTCNLSKYECTKDTEADAHQWELISPDKQWAAYVDHYNLCVRNVSTGEVVQLTHDGERHWDYATRLPSSRVLVEQGTEEVRERPAVFWAPDSSKLITYRIDSRHVGRFTTLQFVPPNQLRPNLCGVRGSSVCSAYNCSNWW